MSNAMCKAVVRWIVVSLKRCGIGTNVYLGPR